MQPVIARQILPWFGGSAAVWTTCMVFFQGALLAGYFYADWVVRRLPARRQALLHTTLLLLSLAVLPITPSPALHPPDAGQPIARILLLLTLTIGLPYLMLATTGPLVQAWFARRYAGTPVAASVWRLYALSNAASMIALLAYPPLIEPATRTQAQSLGWSLGYGLFALLAAASAWSAARPSAPAIRAVPLDSVAAAEAAALPAAPGWRQQALWLVLAALGSVLLLAVTTHMTQNVASVPFLWVLPLVLYLLSFILTFDGRGWYRPLAGQWLAALAGLALMAGLVYRPNLDWTAASEWTELVERGLMPIGQAVPLYALGLFLLCMFCHGELVAARPAPAWLTRFYLMVSLGGAIGGLLVGIVAPLTFDAYWELPAALLAAMLLLAGLAARWPTRAMALLALAGCGALGWQHLLKLQDGTVEMSRNFYGTLRVQGSVSDDAPGSNWRLVHGVITHGLQYRDPLRRGEPTTYYGPSSGIGRAIDALRALDGGRPQQLGLVGMGVGTLAAWGRSGDRYRFYEINPAVVELARRRFSFLGDSHARIETALGDARLVLEREAAQGFDLLAIDAFSSDSIPAHLITREALAVYRRHLRGGGVVAFHISNRYLDLEPVLLALARDAGVEAWQVDDEPPAQTGLYESDWVLLTRNRRLLDALAAAGHGQPLASEREPRLWTDDHHNLFDVLR